MAHPAGPARPGLFLGRALLLLAAADALAAGGWAVLWPAGLFALLQTAPTHDSLLCWRVLGALTLGHVPCLVLGAARPAVYGGLLLVPLFGRALQAGVWLWLLGSERLPLPRRPLGLLLAHDLFWLAALAGLLLAWRGRWRASNPASGGRQPPVERKPTGG
jgi:hypothetical protein